MKLPATADIGHIHLKVSDLDRAIDFYTRVLGFELTQRYGNQAAFVSAGGYHHHIGLNTWQSLNGSPPPPGSTGLFHFAIRLASRSDFAKVVRSLIQAGVEFDGVADHGVSEAVYFRDPDQNGIEVTWDRDSALWPRTPDGFVKMTTDPLDLEALVKDS